MGRPFWGCWFVVKICRRHRAQVIAKGQELNLKLGLHSDESNNLVQNCAEKFPVHVAIQDLHLKQIQ